MDFRRKFEFGLAWRTALLVACVWLFIQAIDTPDLRAGRIVAGLVAFFALASLWTFIRRTNFQVSRFIESVRFEDFSQRFSDPSGGGFDVLGDTLDAALKALQERHMKESVEARYLSAILDDSPSALLTVDEQGRVELLNKSARQLFITQPLLAIDDFEKLGPELAAAVRLPPGTRKITRLMLEGVPHKAIFASAQVARLDRPVTVLSILPLSIAGAAFALLITGKTLNIFSMIGLLLLLGIAKKNSIILVDYAVQKQNEGLSAHDAMMKAGPVRLRPIMMTSIATLMAAVPPALALGPGSETRGPMAVAIIGGLVISTALSLLVVPAFFVVADRAKTKASGWFAKDHDEETEAEEATAH